LVNSTFVLNGGQNCHLARDFDEFSTYQLKKRQLSNELKASGVEIQLR
jgi:hypothetical protein